MARRKLGPYPVTNFPQLVNEVAENPFTVTISGEITASKLGAPLGAVKFPGKVVDVWMSIVGSGKDDSNTLSIEGNVYINGTTCLSTQPKIAHVSGEAATNKTTKVTGSTGITQGVVDADADDVSAGDIITGDIALTRTASPTTEMNNAALVVEIEPDR